MVSITRAEIVGDHLVIRYIDDLDTNVDERAIVVKWKKHEPLVKLMTAFTEIVGHYFLHGNKNLEELSKTDLESLFKDLLKEAEPPYSSEEGC
jgi:hypothetical protein